MDGGNEEGNAGLIVIGKIDELFPDIRIVQIGESSLLFAFEAHTSLLIKIVITAHAIIIQYFEDRLATFAAEVFVVQLNMSGRTGLTTVVTRG